MSTSDSDYSIDWLASDEDDYDSPNRLSPQRAEETPTLPSSSSSSSSSSSPSLMESPPSCFHRGAPPRRRRWSDGCDCSDRVRRRGADADSPAGPQTAALGPVQGFTPVHAQQTPRRSRKRAHGVGSDGLCETPGADTENELFSQKCTELQRYVEPLSSILRGLRSGRYSERLSSFQESVAMDRIQRIMGVLQNPHMGGRFLGIVLKIEEMLQSWFPHVRAGVMRTDDGAAAKKQKQHHHHHSSASSPPPPPSSAASLCSSDVESALVAPYSSAHLKWLHASPICSLKTPESTLAHRAAATASSSSSSASSASPLLARCSREVTQDNAVSSSTDSHTGPPRRLAAARLGRGPLPFKISSPCLERLLLAKESIIAPRTDGGWLS